jgi:hypothetical protein
MCKQLEDSSIKQHCKAVVQLEDSKSSSQFKKNFLFIFLKPLFASRCETIQERNGFGKWLG